MSWGLVDGVYVGDEPPWMTAEELADAARVEQAFAALSARRPRRSVGHPDAAALDAFERRRLAAIGGALPAVRRRHELASLSLSCDAPERTSLLAELRKHAVLGGDGFYDLERWEGLKVAEGSAAVALAMAAELEARLRFGAVVERIDIVAADVRSRSSTASRSMPRRSCARSPPPRSATSRSPASATRGCSRCAPSATHSRRRSWSRTRTRSGSGGAERPCRERVAVRLDLAAGPGSAVAARPARAARGLPRGAAGGPCAHRARGPDRAVRRAGQGAGGDARAAWGSTRSRGDTSRAGRPATSRVGPLHGTHEPPFYVAGSDHWVAGYMEGAVRTGRGAARAALARATRAA